MKREKKTEMRMAVIAPSGEEGLRMALPFLLAERGCGREAAVDVYTEAEWKALPAARRTYRCLLSPLPREEGELYLSTKELTRTVPWKEIRYILSDGHHVRINLGDEVLRVRLPFEQVCSDLAPGPFLVCNRGVLLNMDHIRFADRETFRMRDGTVFYIRRRGRMEIRRAYEKHLQKSGAL